MRHLRLKLKVIWLVLSDQYTHSIREDKWYLWAGVRERIVIMYE